MKKKFCIDTIRKLVKTEIEQVISTEVHHSKMEHLLHYALLPPGKLLRPLLNHALAYDWGGKTWDHSSHLSLSLFLEFFHTYTLVHDDLPCMDNDSQRRGKASLHVYSNEWKALLVGDALQTMAFSQLAKLPPATIAPILKLTQRYLGANGLIYGQYLDLKPEANTTLKQSLEIHHLKTTMLFKTTFLSSFILCQEQKAPLSSSLNFIQTTRLAHALGGCFQLLDDLIDYFCDQDDSFNIFNTHFLQATEQLKTKLLQVQKIISQANLNATQEVVSEINQGFVNKLQKCNFSSLGQSEQQTLEEIVALLSSDKFL